MSSNKVVLVINYDKLMGHVKEKYVKMQALSQWPPLDRLPLHFLLTHQTYKSVLRAETFGRYMSPPVSIGLLMLTYD